MAVDTTLEYAVAELNDGSELRTPYWRLDSGQEGETLAERSGSPREPQGETFLVIAAQHGNEVQGCEVIRRFKQVCEKELQRGTVYLVPFANLPAIRHRRSHISLGPEQPYGDDEGHNMNRTWPGKADGNDTERLAYSLHEAVVQHCTGCLDLHSWSRFTATCTLARLDEGPSQQMAEASAIRFIQWRPAPADGPVTPTTIGGMFNDSGRGAITIELAPQWVIRDKEVTAGLRAAMNVAKMLGMIDGEPELLDGPAVAFTREPPIPAERLRSAPRASPRLEAAVQVKAPCSGMFVEAGLETSDHVEEGQKLGHIIRDDDLETVEIVAPASGYLWQYGCFREHSDVALPPQHPYASEGDMLASVMSA